MVTEYLVDWIALQADTFDSIDGIFLLDDLIGFLRDDDFQRVRPAVLEADLRLARRVGEVPAQRRRGADHGRGTWRRWA